jgi:transposase
MSKRLTLAEHLPMADLEQRYRKASDPVARSQWQILWLLARGLPTEEVARVTGYSLPWIRTIAHRYTAAGPTEVADHRHANPGAAPLLTAADQEDLRAALSAAAAGDGLWSGPQVAAWMAERLGHPVPAQRGWVWLRRLGFTPKVPRPRHALADREAQAAFKKTCLS